MTRDAFEFSNTPGDVALYLARSSLPVVCSAAVPVPESFPKCALPHEWYHTTYTRFFTKSYFTELVDAKPHALILDLIDDRFDYYGIGTVLPGIDDFLGCLPSNQRGQPVDFKTDTGFELWLDGAQNFFAAMKAILPDCPILLHRARWVDADDAYAQLNNAILDRKFSAINNVCRNIIPIEVRREYVVSDDNHKWGRQPFHYVPSYYLEFNDLVHKVFE